MYGRTGRLTAKKRQFLPPPAGQYAARIADPVRRVFAGMLSAVDEGVGNLVGHIRATPTGYIRAYSTPYLTI